MTGYPHDDPQDAVAVAQEQIALWLGMDVGAAEAWQALTGQQDRGASWAMVRAYMIGWQQRRHGTADVLPLFAYRRAA